MLLAEVENLWATVPEAWLPFLADLGRALLQVVLVWAVYLLLVRGLSALGTRGALPAQLKQTIVQIGRWAATVVAAVLVLQEFGMWQDAWTFLSATLALIAVGFIAVWSILSNTLCALVLMLARPFQVGDTVELVGDGLRGRVINFSLLFTTLRETSGELVLIPNNIFFQRAIRRLPGESTVPLDEQLEKSAPTE